MSVRRWQLLAAVLTGVTLVVGACAVYIYATYFPPHYRGWGEVTAHRTIAGWAVNERTPESRVAVQLYIDGRFVGGRVADLPRPDVVAAGRSRDEQCGYSFDIPELTAGEHEARVYALHKVGDGSYRTLQLTGTPLRFRTDASGLPLSARARPTILLPALLTFHIL